jgi:hypothetical protein
MDTTTSGSPPVTYDDWESRIAAPILGIEQFDIPIFDFPFGRPGGPPGVPTQQQAIIRAAVETGARTGVAAAWGVSRLPFAWDADGNRDWEDLVVGQEHEFGIRCAC